MKGADSLFLLSRLGGSHVVAFAPLTKGLPPSRELSPTTVGTSRFPNPPRFDSLFLLSRLGGSNPGPTRYECVALPTELRRLR